MGGMVRLSVAARQLGVDAQTLQRWRRAKKLPAEAFYQVSERGWWLCDLEMLRTAMAQKP